MHLPIEVIDKIYTYGVVSYPFLRHIVEHVSNLWYDRLEQADTFKEWKEIEKSWITLPEQCRIKKYKEELLLEFRLKELVGCFYYFIDFIDENIPKNIIEIWEEENFYESLFNIRDKYNLDMEINYYRDKKIVSIENKKFVLYF